jgi:outer membrane immunogenic protein
MKLCGRVLGLSLAVASATCPFPAGAEFIFYGADQAKEPAWGGFYAGINGGYAWSPNQDQFALAGGVSPGVSPGGAFGGGQIGYNWQGASWLDYPVVLGLEADIQGSSVKTSLTGPNFGERIQANLDWFGTLRGRIGYAFSPLTLLYATGGFAFGGLNNSVGGSGPTLVGSPYKFDGTATGYVFGGGGEYKLTPALSFKLEYQYMDFGRNELTNAAGATLSSLGGGRLATVRNDEFSTLRVGLSYYFGCDEVPLK